jgi:hypothetical protein
MTASTRYLIAPLWCWTLLLFHCTSAVHRKDERLTLDTLRFLSRAVEEIQAHTQTPPLPYLEHLGRTMDSLCEKRIRITRTPDLQDLIAQTDRILVVDTLFSRVQDTSLFHAAIACKELTFRVLVEMQNCLKFAFDNSDAFEKYLADRREAERLEKSYQEYKEDRHEKAYGGLEVHDDYIFKEQVSLLIPYIHANQKSSMWPRLSAKRALH